MNPLAIRHVRDALDRDFSDLIDVTDLVDRPPREVQNTYRSRALAAFAVQHLLGCAKSQAAAFVIDGFDDGYIDAIAVDDLNPRLWLIQAKWSDSGNAGLGVDDAAKLRTGLDYLLNGEFDRFNARFQTIADKVEAAINDPKIQITIVAALAGSNTLAPPVQDVFDKMRRDLNNPQPMLDVAVLGLVDFHRFVREGISGGSIDFDLQLMSPGSFDHPYLAYHGLVAAGQIHAWHEEYGDRLFEQNIRKSLGVTPVNKNLLDTLYQNPEHFSYFNNGVTILAKKVLRNGQFALRVGAPINLRLTGASVVNGAQTVTSISTAMRNQPESASQAVVWVKVFSLESCPPGFANDVTQATNTQNQVTPQDYVALDETQLRLRSEFSLSLHKTYVIKRGEPEPETDAGCSVVEAATALACTHPHRLDLVAHPKQNIDLLWDRGEGGDYFRVFDRNVNAYRVWRWVQVLRAVRAALQNIRGNLEGKPAQLLMHGDLVITSLVARQCAMRQVDDPDVDWQAELDKIPSATRLAAAWLNDHVERNYPTSYPFTLFKSGEKCAAIIRSILGLISGEAEPPQLQPADRATRAERRTSAVKLIVEAGVLPDGAPLEFRAVTGADRKVFTSWLAADPRRGRARWKNSRTAPLIWEADGTAYSPSRLVFNMLEAVGTPVKAVQGTKYWFVPGKGSLVEIAEQMSDEVD